MEPSLESDSFRSTHEPMGGDFILPDGSRFDCDIGVDADIPDFHDYGNLLAKTKDRLRMYGRSPKIITGLASIHAEVGDDEISVDSTPVYAAAELAVFELYLGVKISEEDTSINPRYGNYAEDLVIVPDGYEQTYHFAQQTSNFRDMSFLDVPKLRLAIDIRPGRMTHSATNDGKASMLGSRLAWLPRDSPVRTMWEVFNLMQDVNLGLMRDDKFAYLPTALGGYGKPLPFGKASNFETIIASYKQGAHKELCRELLRRVNRRYREYTVHNRYSVDEVLSAVSRTQSSWHDWIKGKSLYAPTCWLEAPPEVASLRVAKCGVDAVLDSVLRRLEAAGYLVSENDLAIAYEHNQLCSYLVGTETHGEFVERRKQVRKEWISESTFNLRLYGYIAKIGIDQSLQHVLEDEEVRLFTENLRKSRFNLRAFLRQENYYETSAKDLIYMKGPMMVPMSIFPKVTQVGRRYWFEQTKDSQDLSETPEAFMKLLNYVRDGNRGPRPPDLDLVDDDPFIEREILSLEAGSAVCLITDDIRLCRQIMAKTQIPICRVPPKWYYLDIYFGDGDSPWQRKCQDVYPNFNWVSIQDTGSIKSYEEIGFRDGAMLQWPRSRPFSLTKVSWKDGRRVRAAASSSPELEDYSWEPPRFPEGYIFTRMNVFQRRHHPFRRGWA